MDEYQLIRLINGADLNLIKTLPNNLINENEIINDLNFVKLMRYLRINNYGVGQLISICEYISTTQEPISFEFLLNHLNFNENDCIKTELNNCIVKLNELGYIEIVNNTITINESFNSLNNYLIINL